VELAEAMKRLALLLVLVLVLVAAGCGGTKTVTTATTVTISKTVTVTTSASQASAPPCSGADLSGTFTVVPGSAGAGQISYELKLVNDDSAACFVSGLPTVLLIDEQGGRLPTRVSAEAPGTATAARIVLQPQQAATADARFSPDVPGVGEPTAGSDCEPRAFTLHVTFGDGSVEAAIKPPTPVCEHGSLRFSLYSAAH
jgi:Protein of unknown function (DUF4232)